MENPSINQKLSTTQHHNLILSMAMQQAFHVLQMPILELAEWMKLEIEQNPILELTPTDNGEPTDLFAHQNYAARSPRNSISNTLESKKLSYEESLPSYPLSLQEHLSIQARISLSSPLDIEIAELLIENLDSKGFLSIPLENLAPLEKLNQIKTILSILQTFDPSGIGAANLKESLCLQLEHQGKEHSLAYRIVKHHYEDLLHNRIPAICKGLSAEILQVQDAIRTDIRPLDPHPGHRFSQRTTLPITPDVYIDLRDEKWHIHINESFLPHFQLASTYKDWLNDPSHSKEEHAFVRRHLARGKWISRIILRRYETLKKITDYLIEKQASFLSGEQKTLIPITLKDMADALEIHESTATRAVSGKYLSCPQGLFAMRDLFSHSISCANGQNVSQHTLRRLLNQLIQNEDKQSPLSDEKIAKQFKKMGIVCARRTVTKHRERLHIAPSSRRRKW